MKRATPVTTLTVRNPLIRIPLGSRIDVVLGVITGVMSVVLCVPLLCIILVPYYRLVI
ncbi:hypothetical protein [Methanopyrus sp.]